MKILRWVINENGCWTTEMCEASISRSEVINNLYTNIIEGHVPQLEVPVRITLSNGRTRRVTISRLNKEMRLLEQHASINKSPNLSDDEKLYMKRAIKKKLLFKPMLHPNTVKQYIYMVKESLREKVAYISEQ